MKNSRMLSKLALGTFLFTILAGPSPAWTAAANDPASAWLNLDVSLSVGHRVDSLDWNIANGASGESPNILSELKWTDLKIFQLGSEIRGVIKQRFIFKGRLNYGWIYDGKNQDSDYAGDNRTLEFSRSNNNSDDGYVWDGSVGIGPRITFGLSYFELAPLLGYSYHEQNLTMTNGFQTLPPLGAFPGLLSSYDTQWKGPWVGLDLHIVAGQRLGTFENVTIFASFEYHWADYEAQADWNLRPDFDHPKSFEHEADGHGYIVTAGADFRFNQRWSFTMAYSIAQWNTDAGTDRVFSISGGQVVTAETRLNEVNWKSETLTLGAAYHF
jgi:hypothetical protein